MEIFLCISRFSWIAKKNYEVEKHETVFLWQVGEKLDSTKLKSNETFMKFFRREKSEMAAPTFSKVFKRKSWRRRKTLFCRIETELKQHQQQQQQHQQHEQQQQQQQTFPLSSLLMLRKRDLISELWFVSRHITSRTENEFRSSIFTALKNESMQSHFWINLNSVD